MIKHLEKLILVKKDKHIQHLEPQIWCDFLNIHTGEVFQGFMQVDIL